MARALPFEPGVAATSPAATRLGLPATVASSAIWDAAPAVAAIGWKKFPAAVPAAV